MLKELFRLKKTNRGYMMLKYVPVRMYHNKFVLYDVYRVYKSYEKYLYKACLDKWSYNDIKNDIINERVC